MVPVQGARRARVAGRRDGAVTMLDTRHCRADNAPMKETSEISPAEWTQLACFNDHWRVILEDDQPVLVWSLAKGGYLEVLKRRAPLFRLSAKGRETLKWQSWGGVLAKPEPGTAVH